MNIDKFLIIAKNHIDKKYDGNMAECARKLRFDPSTMTRMFNKERPPTKEFLTDIGCVLKTEHNFIFITGEYKE